MDYSWFQGVDVDTGSNDMQADSRALKIRQCPDRNPLVEILGSIQHCIISSAGLQKNGEFRDCQTSLLPLLLLGVFFLLTLC